MENGRTLWLLVCTLALCWASICHSLPVLDDNDDLSKNDTDENNGTLPQDLLVIKTIVYEVGILTDGDDDTSDNSTEISHQIDLTFFDPRLLNGSQIDLTNFPIPIQTNISGVTVTGIAPLNLGTFNVPPPGDTTVQQASDLPLALSGPIIPQAVVTVTHNVSTTDPEKGSLLVAGLPEFLGFRQFTTSSNAEVEHTESSNDVNDSEDERT